MEETAKYYKSFPQSLRVPSSMFTIDKGHHSLRHLIVFEPTKNKSYDFGLVPVVDLSSSKPGPFPNKTLLIDFRRDILQKIKNIKIEDKEIIVHIDKYCINDITTIHKNICIVIPCSENDDKIYHLPAGYKAKEFLATLVKIRRFPKKTNVLKNSNKNNNKKLAPRKK